MKNEEFVIMTYNPSRKYNWTMHRAGCGDIIAERKGIRTDSGFPATHPQKISGDNWKDAIKGFLSGELEEMGYSPDCIRVNPCCKEKGR